MSVKENIQKNIEYLITYLKREDFKGYDPYDTLTSWFPFKYFGSTIQRIALQLQIRNPINLRSLLGIKKERRVKALAIILQGLSVYYREEPSDELKIIMDELFDWIVENRLKEGFEGYCWGAPYPLALSDKNRSQNDPSAVLACFVAESIYEYYLSTKNEKVQEVLEGITKFILTHVPLTESEDGICFSYTTKIKDVIYNANSFVAETFAKTYSFNKDENLKEQAIKCLDFNVANQKEDGSWSYGIHPKTGMDRNQIDFHQGFVLTSFYDTITILDLKDEKYIDSLKKGLEYYKKKQFDEDGSSYWRVPKKFPIDIHNQAVGVITFAKLSEFGDGYLEFANIITEWTNKHLRNDKKGFYYFQRTNLFTNKISYIRWNQAWMLLGLAHLYVKIK